jgi:hypothetical protein
VNGSLNAEWYRPIEAYIPQNVQIIASDGLLFLATAQGLYALDPASGALVWRFETDLPLGNSPTVAGGVVYAGGYDRKLYALRAADGQLLWAFEGGQAGYSANPLVVDGRVLVGNRDGRMYAIGAHGTPQQGQLLWQYQTGGLIDQSAAYANGLLYFASNDNYAYALRADTGALVWRSAKLPGDGFQSYWPVIFRDKVVLAVAPGYRDSASPGAGSLLDAAGNPYGSIFDIQRDALFAGLPDRSLVGSQLPAQAWSGGRPVLDGSRLTEYLENNPAPDPLLHKPWRRVMIVLNQSDGSEYTFDSDGDGHAEYMPAAVWGTHSGNLYPPIVGADGVLYFSNIFQRFMIAQGKIMGWQFGTQYLSVLQTQGAVDEPQALSSGGNTVYRVICCDRVGDYFNLSTNRGGLAWHYSRPLHQQTPGYDAMWYLEEGGLIERLQGNYGGPNGVYNAHGDQNPMVPYRGRLYVHRGNAVLAFGPGPAASAPLPLLTTANPVSAARSPSRADLVARLEAEVQKIVTAGHLRPGYYGQGQFGNYSQFANYFENPGDTLYTLAYAYPHLSAGLQSQVRAYLQAEFRSYFDPAMSTTIGWADGAAREAMPMPPEVQAVLAGMPASTRPIQRFSWLYPPHNFYALWKYAQILPAEAGRAYDLAKSKLVVPVPVNATDAYLVERPFENNAYIAGYLGFLELQSLAGRAGTDAALRASVTAELNRLLALRASTFSKDTPWVNGYGAYHLRSLNIARNFIFLVPELGTYLRQNARDRVTAAVDEYNRIAPYWFVARYNATVGEGVRENLYDYHGMFLANAYVIQPGQAQVAKYLDVPAFERGDLFYIQNLVAAINTP